MHDLAFKIRHPYLSRRKNQLLLVIRFHALRAHFIDSNNLPPKFKVSHYLKRSLTSVLLDFVHISPAAWICLMATANLLYFLSGMLLNSTQTSLEVEEFLMYIFFALMVLFVAFAFVLFFKMKSIFSNILHMKLTVYESQESSRRKTWIDGAVRSGTKYVDQVTLFWWNNPHIIIVAMQYMQFGYALGIAMIFTYYKDFSSSYTLVNPIYLLLVLLLSYLIFLHFVSVIIPWYTLCTSMGQLVNKERLHETFAKMKLSEEIRKKETLDEERKFEEEMARRKKEIEAKNAVAAARVSDVPMLSNLSIEDPHHSEQRKGSAGMLNIFRNRSSDASDGPSSPSSLEQRKGSTGMVRTFQDRSGDAFDEGQRKSWLRHTRKKSLSDGVLSMMPSIDLHHGGLSRSDSGSPTGSSGSARLSAAAALQLHIADEDEPQLDESLFKTEVESSYRNLLAQPVHVKRERYRLTKSISDNVAFMRATDSTDPFAPENFPLKHENPVSAPKGDAETQNNIDQSLKMVGTEKVFETGRHPRQRSNSTEAAMMRSIDEADVVNGGSSGPSKMGTDRAESSLGRHERKQKRRIMKTQSEGVAFMRSSLPTEKAKLSLDSLKGKEPEKKLTTLTELTQMSTKDLPEVVNLSQKVRPRRRPRARSSSEGVSLMTTGLTSETSSTYDTSVSKLGKGLKENIPKQEAKGVAKMRSIEETDVVNGDHSGPSTLFTLGRHERKQRRRLRTQSEGVAFMQSSRPTETARLPLDSIKEKEPEEKLATLTELTQMSAKDLPDLPEIPDLSPYQPRRRQRLKSASEGVSFMRAGRTVNISSAAPIKVPTDDTVSVNSEKYPKEFPPKQELGGVTPANESAKNKVTFLLAKSSNNISPAETTLDLIESVSVDSTASDDGESDIDDVPEALLFAVTSQSRLQAIAQKIDLAAFFQGSRYRIISLIFGPMACFFFVAMRVEIFNIYAGVFVDQTNIWYKYLGHFFWVEVSLYCLMIIEMFSVLVVFLMKRGRQGALLSCSAATFGLLINVMCLLLLLIAEMKRCCPDNKEDVYWRLLASAPSKSKDYDPAAEYVECCPQFGERRYGGLGKIEPFTCLIAISPLRFLVAWYVVKLFGCGASHDEDKDSNNGSHGQHHGPDPTSKVRDLWMTAIGVHSDIAKSCGVFSGELLQCMLGIYSSEIVSEEPEVSVGDPESSDANNESTGHDSNKHHERENSLEITSDTSSRGITSPLNSPATKRYESDDFGVTFDDFAYPKARLIRRMRRCERRLLPLLNEWMVVDVVITGHEVVLFDVLDETEGRGSTPENAISTYNNGGKGLRLCDVAKGRKIMDQFNLDDVDFVDIEHRAAIPGGIDDEDIEVNRSNLLEYWQGGSCWCEDFEVDAMNKRWGHVDEDRLKIHFKYNTLYLRFMVDLKEMEHKSKALLDDSDLLNHVGTQTKLWCRTIARLRGAMNLKQKLPHFGNEGTDEMEDFIEMCERDHEGGHLNTKKKRKNLHRRMSSFNLSGGVA